jgi:hypothetical protein
LKLQRLLLRCVKALASSPPKAVSTSQPATQRIQVSGSCPQRMNYQLREDQLPSASERVGH